MSSAEIQQKKKQIEEFALGFLEDLKRRKKLQDNTDRLRQLKNGTVKKGLGINERFSIGFFNEWGYKDESLAEKKLSYLILFKDGRYIWELFLSRMLFDENGRITWYLDVPSSPENLEAYNEVFEDAIDIPISIVESIKEQGVALHQHRVRNNLKKVHKGYLIGKENDSLSNIFKELDSLLNVVIRANTEALVSQDDLTSVWEGEVRRSTHKWRRRASSLVGKCKKRDDYTCQGCGLRLSVNKKNILHVHHKKPLRNVVATKLEDIVSLCPSCHYIAHLRKPTPYNASEIKEFRKTKHKFDPHISLHG